jgi:hypothetical protein
MPLPKPLKKSAKKSDKKKVMEETMSDLKKGPHHKDRSKKQEVAIGLKQSGQSDESKTKKAMKHQRKDANRMTRNKGRK